MHLKKPRIEPLAEEELAPETRAAFGDRPVLGIFRTLGRYPKLLKRWLVFGNHVLSKSSLPDRDRELLILRIGWLCRAEYEWGQHVPLARSAGLSGDEIERIAEGPTAEGWSRLDHALLKAVDELHRDAFLCDETWRVLDEHYSLEQKLDLLFTVGQYNMVSMVLNSLGVQPEPGSPGLPAP